MNVLRCHVGLVLWAPLYSILDLLLEPSWVGGVGICLLLYPCVTLLVVCVRTLRRSVIYYILLAAIGAVNGVFAYYPHSGGQA